MLLASSPREIVDLSLYIGIQLVTMDDRGDMYSIESTPEQLLPLAQVTHVKPHAGVWIEININ